MDEDGTSSDPAQPRVDRACGHALVEVSDPRDLLGRGGAEWVRAGAERAMAHLGAGGAVRVRVVGDTEMIAAHERHKGQPGTTDVLTFDLREQEGDELDTDILVCADEARRQAESAGHPPRREALLYVVHGVLHCLGYDDGDERSAALMHRREDEVLEAIGVGATYAPGVAGGAAGRDA